MNSIRSPYNFLTALAEASALLRPLLSKENDFVWSKDCQLAFQVLKTHVANIVELKNFDVHKDFHIVCDVSQNEFGAVLEEQSPKGWRPISFASRYLNPSERKYSANKLELLASVAEYFRNYLCGRKFTKHWLHYSTERTRKTERCLVD